MEVFVVLVGLALSFVVGLLIGLTRDNGPLGAVLGLLLGPIGWIIALLLDDRPQCLQCGGRLVGRYPKCPHCGSDVDWAKIQEERNRLAAEERNRLAADWKHISRPWEQ